MNILDKFWRVTSYDLQKYFADFEIFIIKKLPQIVNYYQGNSSVDKTVFTELNRLYNESLKIEKLISVMNSSLSNDTEFWDLIDNISNIKVKLETSLNLCKWLRSSYVYGYENRVRFEYILKQRQTLENLSLELGSDDPNFDWVELAVSNSMMESDYDKEGGNIMNINRKDSKNMNITTVVDVMVGNNILGKDITKFLQFIDDDVLTLDTSDTMEQSADICLNVMRGSVPEFPTLGISKHFVGTNLNSIMFASLNREVVNNFKTDDSFKKVQMIDNRIEEDRAYYDFRIESRLHQEINRSI